MAVETTPARLTADQHVSRSHYLPLQGEIKTLIKDSLELMVRRSWGPDPLIIHFPLTAHPLLVLTPPLFVSRARRMIDSSLLTSNASAMKSMGPAGRLFAAKTSKQHLHTTLNILCADRLAFAREIDVRSVLITYSPLRLALSSQVL